MLGFETSFLMYYVQENVLAESRMMVPDCHKRLEAALTDLKGTLVSDNFTCFCNFFADKTWSLLLMNLLPNLSRDKD